MAYSWSINIFCPHTEFFTKNGKVRLNRKCKIHHDNFFCYKTGN